MTAHAIVPWHALRDARLAAGLTLHGLAVLLGAREMTVWRWESGMHRPRPETLRRIRDVLGDVPAPES